jgi:hypothetical protein
MTVTHSWPSSLRDTPAVRPSAVRAGIVAGGLALALAGCSGSGEDTAGATPTPSSTPTTSEGATVPDDGPLDRDQACAAMFVSGETTLEKRIGDTLVEASQTFDPSVADQMHVVALELGDLEQRVPDDFAPAVQKLRVPFTQMQEHLDAATGDSVQLDVGSAADGLEEYRALCS